MLDGCYDVGCGGSFSGIAAQTFATAVTQLVAAQCLLSEHWPKDYGPTLSEDDEFDIIIVGAGAAGSIIANRLTEITDWNVLLIEAGGDPPLESIVPGFSGSTRGEDLSWQFYSENDGFTNQGKPGGRGLWTAGRMLGGTTSTNAMYYSRGNREDYDLWAREGNDGWDFESVLPYFKKSERLIDIHLLNDPIATNFHGLEGPMVVDVLNYTYPAFSDLLLQAYNEIGIYENPDFNGISELGVGKIRGHIFEGRRVSTATAFLNAIGDRNNLFLLKNALVNNVVINSETFTATAVNITAHSGKILQIKARREVIVSAGAFKSPQILMLSGIGPAEQLAQYGIANIVQLAVGENFHDHVRVPLFVTINEIEGLESPSTILSAVQYLATRSGSLAGTLSQPNINAFIALNDDQTYPDFQIHHNFFLKNSSDFEINCYNSSYVYGEELCTSLKSLNEESAMVIFLVTLSHPYSRGQLSLQSIHPKDNLKIETQYFTDQRDIRTMIAGLNKVSELIVTPTFQALGAVPQRFKSELCDSYEYGTDDYWYCAIRVTTASQFHPVGTVKMGPPSDSKAVVNDDLHVYGIHNLRVADASIMPHISRGNTNAATMMIAEKVSDKIKASYGYK